MLKTDINSGIHMPGHNYTGPGTNAIAKMIAGVQPADHNDAVSQQHDINYYKVKTLKEEYEADALAAAQYDSSMIGKGLSGVMKAKMVFNKILMAAGRETPLMGGKSELEAIGVTEQDLDHLIATVQAASAHAKDRKAFHANGTPMSFPRNHDPTEQLEHGYEPWMDKHGKSSDNDWYKIPINNETHRPQVPKEAGFLKPKDEF